MKLKRFPEELESLLQEIGFEPTTNEGQYAYDINAYITHYEDDTVYYQICVGNSDMSKLSQVLDKCEKKLIIVRSAVELYLKNNIE